MSPKRLARCGQTDAGGQHWRCSICGPTLAGLLQKLQQSSEGGLAILWPNLRALLAVSSAVPFVHLLSVAVVFGAVSAVLWPADASATAAVGTAAVALAVAVPAGRGRHGLVLVAAAALAASHAGSARDAVLAPSLGVWFAGRSATGAPVVLRGVLTEDAALTASGAVRVRLAEFDGTALPRNRLAVALELRRARFGTVPITLSRYSNHPLPRRIGSAVSAFGTVGSVVDGARRNRQNSAPARSCFVHGG